MNDTYEDKVKKRLSNNKPVVIIGKILGALIIIASAYGAFRTFFPKKEPIKIEPVNLESVMIIDNIDDSSIYYHFEVTNTSNSPIKNLTYANGNWEFANINDWFPFALPISAHATIRLHANPIRTKFPRTAAAPIILIAMYYDEKDSIKHCLFRFLLTIEDLKTPKTYKYDLKNCESGEYSQRRLQTLLNIAGIDTAKNPEIIVVPKQ